MEGWKVFREKLSGVNFPPPERPRPGLGDTPGVRQSLRVTRETETCQCPGTSSFISAQEQAGTWRLSPVTPKPLDFNQRSPPGQEVSPSP